MFWRSILFHPSEWEALFLGTAIRRMWGKRPHLGALGHGHDVDEVIDRERSDILARLRGEMQHSPLPSPQVVAGKGPPLLLPLDRLIVLPLGPLHPQTAQSQAAPSRIGSARAHHGRRLELNCPQRSQRGVESIDGIPSHKEGSDGDPEPRTATNHEHRPVRVHIICRERAKHTHPKLSQVLDDRNPGAAQPGPDQFSRFVGYVLRSIVLRSFN